MSVPHWTTMIWILICVAFVLMCLDNTPIIESENPVSKHRPVKLPRTIEFTYADLASVVPADGAMVDIAPNTTAHFDQDKFVIVLYGSDIAYVHDDRAILDTHGATTETTAKRITSAIEQFGFGCRSINIGGGDINSLIIDRVGTNFSWAYEPGMEVSREGIRYRNEITFALLSEPRA